MSVFLASEMEHLWVEAFSIFLKTDEDEISSLQTVPSGLGINDHKDKTFKALIPM